MISEEVRERILASRRHVEGIIGDTWIDLAIRGKAEYEINAAANELYEGAALASRAVGDGPISSASGAP